VRERKLGVALVALSLALGCASYSEKTKSARTALDAGRPEEALKFYNERLEVESAKELPKDVSGENTLLLLDRAMILQQLQDYANSSRDLEVSDKQIEILDFSRGAIDDIGKYLFSDSTGPYKAPIYEKLLINTVNMTNYLATSDLSGARVEARRLAVMQKFISDHENRGAELTGPGSYLAGFVFEKSGELDSALRYYDEALQNTRFESLREPVARLASKSSYRTPRIRELIGEAAGGKPVEVSDEPATELLVVLNYGRVPAKIPKRIPIGLALTYASGIISPSDAARANELAAQGLVTWINYPVLGESPRSYGQPLVSVDGTAVSVEVALAVDVEARKAWDDARGAVVASAITRMIARVLAGETTKRAAGGGLVGTLLSLGTQATLTATDIPDTRSWSTLPGRVALARLTLPPGPHTVQLAASGNRRSAQIKLEQGDWAVVNLTVLR
jgi:tetratricopeptide (TPR) repeat protein